MSELEKIQVYISNTKAAKDCANYSMRFGEIVALAGKCKESAIDGLILAFKYGQAKGYRAGKRAAKA